MAQHHDEFTGAGARLVAISVDPPQVNAALAEKLQLPFPVLSDPDGAGAIKPYDVWHDGKAIARPAVIVVDPEGEETFRQVGVDFTDRVSEPDLVEVVRHLSEQRGGLGAVTQEAPRPVDPQPSEKAFPLAAASSYFKGARFASLSLGTRAPDAKETAQSLQEEADRYLEAFQALQS